MTATCSTCRSRSRSPSPTRGAERRRSLRPPASGASGPSASSPPPSATPLETRFAEVWVEGEISNCRVWNTGHLYFTLKDAGAQIKARDVPLGAARRCGSSPKTACTWSRAGASASTTRRASTSSSASTWSRRALGALQLAFEQLKKRLQAEGLFDAARKRPLPALPRKIGIVTSLDGAAMRDIIKVISRRHPNAHLVIRPTRVQGEGAAADIARALRGHRAGAGRRRRHRRRAAAGRSRTSGRSTRRPWRARSPARPVPVISGRRPRDRLHDRGLRRRPARADAVGRRRDRRGRQGRVLRAHRPPRRPAEGLGAVAPRTHRGPTLHRLSGTAGAGGVARAARAARPALSPI